MSADRSYMHTYTVALYFNEPFIQIDIDQFRMQAIQRIAHAKINSPAILYTYIYIYISYVEMLFLMRKNKFPDPNDAPAYMMYISGLLYRGSVFPRGWGQVESSSAKFTQ